LMTNGTKCCAVDNPKAGAEAKATAQSVWPHRFADKEGLQNSFECFEALLVRSAFNATLWVVATQPNCLALTINILLPGCCGCGGEGVGTTLSMLVLSMLSTLSLLAFAVMTFSINAVGSIRSYLRMASMTHSLWKRCLCCTSDLSCFQISRHCNVFVVISDLGLLTFRVEISNRWHLSQQWNAFKSIDIRTELECISSNTIVFCLSSWCHEVNIIVTTRKMTLWPSLSIIIVIAVWSLFADAATRHCGFSLTRCTINNQSRSTRKQACLFPCVCSFMHRQTSWLEWSLIVWINLFWLGFPLKMWLLDLL